MRNHDHINFGALELDIMSVLWEVQEPITVAEVQSHITQKRELAYTTVLTVLSNLYKKQAVDRARRGKAHVYWARHKKEQAAAGLFSNLLQKFYGNNPAHLLAGFLKSRESLSADQLAELKGQLQKLEDELEE